MKQSHRNVVVLAAAAILGCFNGVAGAATCYTIYDRNDAVVYRATFPPIDMSSDGDAQRDAMRAAGQFLIFGESETCPPVEYRFGEAGNKNLSIDNIIGGIRPMTVNRSPTPAAASAARSSR